MKKGKYILTTLITLLSLQLALAQNQVIDRTIDSLTRAFVSIFAPILGTGYGEFLFAKILLFFVIFSVVYMSLNRVDLLGGNRGAILTVTVVTSILSVRYIRPGEFMRAILLPYTSLGVAISIFIPLLIYFYFLHSASLGGFGRRAGWFVYGSVFAVLWLSREYQLLGNANWIYILGFGFILASFMFDGAIHRYFSNYNHSKLENEIRESAIQDWISKLKQAENNSDEKRARQVRKILRRRFNIKS